jgi:S-adenosyl-L-methionine hydrolase (adenosine-forming)
MIVLFTDFGMGGPYVGQVHAVLAQQAPFVPVIDLFHEAPRHDIRAAAYLLPAYTRGFPPGAVFVCVVDPGVGGARRALIVKADHRWYVGPDNGLFHMLARRARDLECREVLWRPAQLSASFHGRDLFAPVATQLVRGLMPDCVPATLTPPAPDWPEDLAQVLYIDHFGNAITGLRADHLGRDVRLRIGGTDLTYARTYSEVRAGQGFWYENANGLVEIAVNQARASDQLGIAVGDSVGV